MDYTVWIVSPEGYQHSSAFTESGETLSDGLNECGHSAKVSTLATELSGRIIIIGAHLLSFVPGVVLPDDTIILNSEQLGTSSEFVSGDYVELMRNFELWDYSHLNIEYLDSLGIKAKYCEIGYASCLSRIKPLEIEDIDVLFFGSLNERRLKIIDDLKKSGINVVVTSNLYGKERDDLIARSKLVLNIHFYAAKIFEIFRCSYLMANKKCIVSEVGLDYELEYPYREGIAFTEYGGLVGRVQELLYNDDERNKIGQRGFELFSHRPQANILKELVCNI